MNIKELLEKYDISPNSFYNSKLDYKEKQKKYIEERMESWSQNYAPPSHFFYSPKYKSFTLKWRKKTVYGFDSFKLGSFFPDIWIDLLDEFFEYVKIENPDFEIQEIKIRYGCLEVKLNNVNEETKQEIKYLEENCWEEHLV